MREIIRTEDQPGKFRHVAQALLPSAPVLLSQGADRLYENGTRFEPVIVDLRDEASSAAFRALWPMAKMPVLRDDALDHTVAESTIIVGSDLPDRPRKRADQHRAVEPHHAGPRAMCKSALIGFTKGLARDVGGRGITVNVADPGSTDTHMNPAMARLPMPSWR